MAHLPFLIARLRGMLLRSFEPFRDKHPLTLSSLSFPNSFPGKLSGRERKKRRLNLAICSLILAAIIPPSFVPLLCSASVLQFRVFSRILSRNDKKVFSSSLHTRKVFFSLTRENKKEGRNRDSIESVETVLSWKFFLLRLCCNSRQVFLFLSQRKEREREIMMTFAFRSVSSLLALKIHDQDLRSFVRPTQNSNDEDIFFSLGVFISFTCVCVVILRITAIEKTVRMALTSHLSGA